MKKTLLVLITLFAGIAQASPTWICQKSTESQMVVQFGLSPFYLKGFLPAKSGGYDELNGPCEMLPGEIGGTGPLRRCYLSDQSGNLAQVEVLALGNAGEWYSVVLDNQINLPCNPVTAAPPSM